MTLHKNPWLALAALALALPPLLAQLAPGDAPAIEEKVVVQAITVLDFNQVTFIGTLEKPSSSFMSVKPGARFVPLIPVRMDMLPELVSSVDHL